MCQDPRTPYHTNMLEEDARLRAMSSQDILRHILWHCMDEEDAEALWVSGFHLVSWTYYAAYFAFARKHVDTFTLRRYYGHDHMLVGPNGRRGSPWKLGMVGGISKITISHDDPDVNGALAKLPDYALANVETVALKGAESLRNVAMSPAMFGVVRRLCVKEGGAAALVICNGTAQDAFMDMYGYNRAAVECVDCFGGVERVEIRNACSAAHILAIMAVLPRVTRLTIAGDEELMMCASVLTKAFSWKLFFKQHVIRLDTCDGVRELVLDGTHGAVAQMLRDLCFDWDLERQRRRGYNWGNIVFTDEAQSYCPEFPMKNVMKVVVDGPIWRNYSRNVLMPGVTEIEFRSLPFATTYDEFDCIGPPVAQMCYASFPGLLRIVLRLDQNDSLTMDSCIGEYNASPGIANAEVRIVHCAYSTLGYMISYDIITNHGVIWAGSKASRVFFSARANVPGRPVPDGHCGRHRYLGLDPAVPRARPLRLGDRARVFV